MFSLKANTISFCFYPSLMIYFSLPRGKFPIIKYSFPSYKSNQNKRRRPEKKVAVLLDFVQITPPPPPLNLDNLYHFF